MSAQVEAERADLLQRLGGAGLAPGSVLQPQAAQQQQQLPPATAAVGATKAAAAAAARAPLGAAVTTAVGGRGGAPAAVDKENMGPGPGGARRM